MSIKAGHPPGIVVDRLPVARATIEPDHAIIAIEAITRRIRQGSVWGHPCVVALQSIQAILDAVGEGDEARRFREAQERGEIP